LDSRTWFAVGGVSTVAASVAVVCLVALTNAAALADSAGAPVSVGPVVVPTPSGGAGQHLAHPTASPSAPYTPTATAEPLPPVQSRVDAVTDATRAGSGTTVASAPAHVIPATAEAALAESRAAGTWDAVREWATSVGWSQGRIDAWVTRLENEVAQTDPGAREPASVAPSLGTAPAHKNFGRSAGADVGSKKDQSRDSPVRRD
jgi:hypothetical protein